MHGAPSPPLCASLAPGRTQPRPEGRAAARLPPWEVAAARLPPPFRPRRRRHAAAGPPCARCSKGPILTPPLRECHWISEKDVYKLFKRAVFWHPLTTVHLNLQDGFRLFVDPLVCLPVPVPRRPCRLRRRRASVPSSSPPSPLRPLSVPSVPPYPCPSAAVASRFASSRALCRRTPRTVTRPPPQRTQRHSPPPNRTPRPNRKLIRKRVECRDYYILIRNTDRQHAGIPGGLGGSL